MIEKPFYVLYQDAKRAYIPKMLMVLGLGAVFFFGIWLNLNLLRAEEQTKSIVLVVVAVVMLMLVLAETLMSYRKAKKYPYYFFQNRIQSRGKAAYYGNIDNIYLEKKFFDKLFNTGTIVLHPYMKMNNIKNSDYMLDYMKQLLQRAGRAYY